MIRRHFFLVAALVILVLMGSAGAYKLLTATKNADSSPAGPAAGAPAGAAGGGRSGSGGRGGGGGGGGGRGTSVTQAVIAPHTFVDRLQVLGVAKGRQSVTLTSNTAELVQAVLFKSGDHVQQNQVLVQLKSTEEDANVTQAKSDLSLAKINADRWNTLAAQGVAPKNDADQYQAAYDHAKAALDAAQSRVGDRVIKAPFTGVLGLSDLAPGALITPGTAIATLDDISVMTVDFDVPDRFLPLIHEGGAITATTDAYPGERYTGRIAKLDTRIDERTRTIKARAEFPNPGGKLKPGMLMRVGVDRGTRQSPGAPEASVQFSGGQAYVFLITARNGGLYAEQHNVVTGDVEDGLIEVTDGLQIGDKVIADGLNRITPNQAISIAGGGRGGAGGGGGPGGGGRGGGRGGDSAGAPAAGGGGGPGGPAGKGGGRGGGRGGGGRGAGRGPAGGGAAPA